MITFPNCKINLGLRVLGKREDGYHDIETIFYPVGWTDVLEMIPSDDGEFEFSTSGVSLDIKEEQNICVKAYRLAEMHCCVNPVKMHLHKCIPAGSGLGGGSSDAAFAIAMLNELFELGQSRNFMEEVAVNLGSDCAFFFRRKPLLARGRGNCFSPVSLSLKNKYILIVVPPVSVSTADAYQWVTPPGFALPSLDEVISLPRENWREQLINDFEVPVFSRFPMLSDIKNNLYDSGAFYASLSGSGSALYGIFDGKPDITGKFPGCTTWSGLMG